MRHKKRQYSIHPLFRAITVISAAVILATGVTFAALQSQNAVMTGNSIQTATANLKIGSSAATLSSSMTGFTFGEVVPGATTASPSQNAFMLKNLGIHPMKIRAFINSVPGNTGNVNLSNTYFVIKRQDSGVEQCIALSSLIAPPSAGGVELEEVLGGGTLAEYKAYAAMDADAFSGSTADITNINLVFVGTVVTQ